MPFFARSRWEKGGGGVRMTATASSGRGLPKYLHRAWTPATKSTTTVPVSSHYFGHRHSSIVRHLPFPRDHQPRPNSSIMMRESLVAVEIMADASSISAMKVETPRCCASPAPTLANTASRTLMSADSHGTKLPTYATSVWTQARNEWRHMVVESLVNILVCFCRNT